MKNRLLLLTSFVLCLLMGASPTMQAQKLKLIPADKGSVLQMLPSVVGQQQRHNRAIQRLQLINEGNWAYYEDFEECLTSADGTYPLPEGWVSVATPGYDDDVWHAGGVVDYFSYSLLEGADGGTGMGMLLGSSKHNQDAWAITPMFTLEAGKEYRIKFYVWFYGYEDREAMTAWLGKSQDVESMTTLISGDLETAYSWTRVEYTIVPEQTEQYCIGFHGQSVQYAEAVLIDYITVSSGPIFYGDESIAFPATTTLDPPQTSDYYVYNAGIGSLEVTLDAAQTSPEITVEGLPLSVVADDWDQHFTVKLDVQTPGEYSGQLVLNTNDPEQPTVVIPVTESVAQSYETGRWFDDFTKGQPEGWSISKAYFTKNDGIDGSMSLWGMSSTGMQFTTHFTDLGSNPTLSFYYHPQLVNSQGARYATSADIVKLNVEISDDSGVTWDSIYAVNPESNPYVEVDGFTRVDVDLSAYANKVCKVRVSVPSYYDFNTATYEYKYLNYTFDNIELGTKVANDLSVRYLCGDRNYRVGEPATINAVVRNSGLQDVTSYTVRLVKTDGTVLATTQAAALVPEQIETVALTWTPDQAEVAKVRAQVVLDGDEDNTYDYSDEMIVEVAPTTADELFIGDSTFSTVSAEPLCLYYNEIATQTIYLANEINCTDGNIYGLQYYTRSPNEYITGPVQIWIGETDKADFSDSQFVPTMQLQQVYNGSVYLPADQRGYVSIPLSKPYQYQGGNLVVYVYRTANHFLNNHYFYSCADNSQRTITCNSANADKISPDDPQSSSISKSLWGYYPTVSFVFDMPTSGKLWGIVMDEQGNGIEGATVTIQGTQLSVVTDANGQYAFSNVAYGDHTLAVTSYGFTDNQVTVTVDADDVRQDIVMSPIPSYTVSGIITDKQDGTTVSGALVRLIGYDSFIGTTDANGKYEIAGVYGGDGYSYDVIVSAPYYKNLTSTTIQVNADLTANYQLDEQNFPVRNAKVNNSGKVANISWQKPLPEYRYDSGIPNGTQFSLSTMNEQSSLVIGATYRHATTLRDIEWYLTDFDDPHSEVNIVIFGLDEQGEPDYDVVYKKTVSNNDNQWNIYELPEPIEMPQGFCISLSSDYYLSIAQTDFTDQYPQATRGYYYNSRYDYDNTTSTGSRTYPWHDCWTYATGNLMLRAVGEGYGTLDSEFAIDPIDDSERAINAARGLIHEVEPVSYTIYRYLDGESQDDWVLVADGVTDMSYTDATFKSLPAGDYHYVVIANYLNGSSDPRLTETVWASSVIEHLEDANALTDGNVYTIDGRLVSTNGIEGLDAGIYICNGQKIAIK